MTYKNISKDAKDYSFWCVMCIYLAILFVAFIANYIFIYFNLIKFIYITHFVILMGTIMTMMFVSIVPDLVEQNFLHYIDDTKIESQYGIFVITKKMVLLKNVQKISVRKNILSRIFRISTLILSTTAGDIKIYMLDEKSLESLYTNISRKIEEN